MPCDTKLSPGQTIQQRAAEVKEAVTALDKALQAGRARVAVSKEGAIAFDGWSERNRVTDACAFRRIMAVGSPLARQAIAKAQQIAGVAVSRQTLAQGVHSHDGGVTWHRGH